MPYPYGAKKYHEVLATRQYRPWHDALIDFMLANPRATLEQKARHFNSSPSYISLIEHTDMFRARWEARRAEFTELIHESIATKTAQVADKALGLMLDVLDKKKDQIPFAQLADVTFKSLEKLGYGAPAGAGGGVTIINGNAMQVVAPVSPQALEEARLALRRSEEQRRLPPLAEGKSAGPGLPPASEARSASLATAILEHESLESSEPESLTAQGEEAGGKQEG